MKTPAQLRASRAYNERNRDQIAADNRARYAADPEKSKTQSRQWAQDHPDRRKAIQKKHNDARQNVNYLKRRHGLTPDQFTAIWQAQQGCCYLCELPLADGLWAIDHDHGCCPAQKSCDNCRRGIAHRTCNAFIGHFGDNPELIERVAANLRIAGRGVQNGS